MPYPAWSTRLPNSAPVVFKTHSHLLPAVLPRVMVGPPRLCQTQHTVQRRSVSVLAYGAVRAGDGRLQSSTGGLDRFFSPAMRTEASYEEDDCFNKTKWDQWACMAMPCSGHRLR